ncbi:zinc ABC transporter ATP-binding protein ZnuC [Vibrio rarus]|uniref:zinc ABC transporter ATP-binding protein ZnuC n=1 Tax=Vibrio rarus TaxID=413403 RepID=UPI0021C33F88|nr:zinc ABC transporter ATP-binding protein ZnuC [Vibrio rarus]
MTQLVTLQDVTVQFDQRKVLDNITLTINEAEITTLVGPNGAGKSTLVKVILGLHKHYTGKVSKLNKLRIGYVPQKLLLNESLPLTVDRFLRLAGKYSQQERQDALALVGATHLLHSDVHKLSGGESQRVLMSRALLIRPQLLVLDEPAQGMDVQGQIELYSLIDTLRHRFNCAVFMISHDLHLVMAKTDTVICLHHHICCSGAPAAISSHPSYLQMFGEAPAASLALYQHQHQHHHHDLSGTPISGDMDTCHNPKHGHQHRHQHGHTHD